MIKRDRGNAVKSLHTVADILGNGVDPLRFREIPVIGVFDDASEVSSLFVNLQGTVFRIEKLIGLAVLVQCPDDFVIVGHEIRRELQSDTKVNVSAPGVVDVHQAGRYDMVLQKRTRLVDEGHGDDLRLMSFLDEGFLKIGGQEFGAAGNIRNLNRRDRNLHESFSPPCLL